MIFFALLQVDPSLLGSITGGGIAPPYVPNLPNEKESTQNTNSTTYTVPVMCNPSRGYRKKGSIYEEIIVLVVIVES